MNYVAVLPSIYQSWTEACLATCKLTVLVIDNTQHNRGVAASWNLGIDKMIQVGADWLIILSAAIRFGAAGGLDFLQYLEDNPEALVVEAGLGMGWHFIAFARGVINVTGRFDENFYPACWEDIDYGNRLELAIPDIRSFWHKPVVNVALAGWGHGVMLGGVNPNTENLRDYMMRKWGSISDAPQYKHPFNDPNNAITYWPEPLQ